MKQAVRSLKQVCLTTGKSCGLFKLASTSGFRNSRVLVLGYHGVSLEDEHLWNPSLYLSADTFRRRMEALKRSRCTVLSLEEGLSRIAAHKLPERSVVLTFDDGTYDFYRIVWPILREFGYPATVLYLTTYYVEHQYASTPYIWSYMLWKANGSRVNAREILGKEVMFNLEDQSGRAEALRQVRSLAVSEKMDANDRNILSEKLAHILGLDFTLICNRRTLQLLSPEEVQELACDGVSAQMHMHLHQSPTTREAYIDNLEANRHFIEKLTGSKPNHFCYLSGRYSQQNVSWLRNYGIESATTCEPGLFSAKTERLLIPRLLDSSNLSDTVFESWLVGIGALMPHAGMLRSHASWVETTGAFFATLVVSTTRRFSAGLKPNRFVRQRHVNPGLHHAAPGLC
jgi:peptidoglycan/xylan/chitin deacetylase (PgdA/CDA1 family)